MIMTDKVAVPAEVIARQVGEETVILDLASGTYFGLDPVGARIWQLLTEGNTLTEVCLVMLAEYEVALEDIERDVLSLVMQLREKQLIVAA